MSGFLSGLFGVERKSASPNNAVERAMGSTVAHGGQGSILTGTGSANWTLEKTITDAYERVIWVYRCVDAIASAQAGLRIRFKDTSYQGVVPRYVDDPQIDHLLNKRPNGYESAVQFRYRLSSQLLLSKKGVFIEVVPARNGRAGALHILPSDRVTPIPDKKTFVKGYKVQKGPHEADFDMLKPEQVIWIRNKPHPTKPFEQVTPLMAAGLAVETDWLARLYNRQFLANNGKPGLLINIRSLLNMADADEIKRRFSGGPMMAGQTTVLESEGIDIIDMFSSPADVQWLEAIKGAKEDILLAFGVAESFLGNASGRTFDNADAEFEITWTTTMVGHCDSIANGFDRLTESQGTGTPRVQDTIEPVFDYSTVDVLQRQERNRHAKADADFAAGKITHDEWRIACGMEPWDIPETRVVWLPAGKVPLGRASTDTKAAAALTPVGMGVPADPAAEAERGAIIGSQLASRQIANLASARALQIAGRKVHPRAIEGQVVREVHDDPEEDDRAGTGPDNEFRALIEGTIDGTLGAWSSRQAQVAAERLEHVKVRKHTRHDTVKPSTKALDPKYVVEMDKWKADVRRDLEAALKPLADRQARRAALDLDRAGIVAKMNAKGKGNPNGRSALARAVSDPDALTAAVLADVLEMVEKAAERQTDRVAEKIAQMDADGASLKEIKKAVKDMVDARGSWRKSLAIHATTAMMEGVKQNIYAQAGNLIERKWNTQGDESVRSSHKKANGQTRLSSRPFRVGQSRLMFPGDPTAPIEETANCRCYVSWSTI